MGVLENANRSVIMVLKMDSMRCFD